MLETSHPPVYYLPPDDVRRELLAPASGSSFCEWKGHARYFTLRVRDREAPRVAWSYHDPSPAFGSIRDHLAFYAGPMDECTVAGERVRAQPGGFYGGWITADVVGPFKWGRLGPLAFVSTLVSPLLRAVGEAWAEGRLEVRHEHFAAERIGDLLRTFRLPFEERARGPLVVFGTLPGESHGLGLQMAALVLATVGCRVCYLGTDVPLDQFAALAKDLGARAVAVSVSSASRGARAAHVRRLRALLPPRVVMLVGGEGAPARCPRIESMQDLGMLHAWGSRIVQAG